jgi:protein-L-isoaspartate(D-aspartate) O-methyltransferase
VLAALVRHVYSIEIIAALSARAAAALAEQKIGNVTLGWPEHAPYDGIIVTAAANSVPPALVAQLRPGGRMVIPLGVPYETQMLTVIAKETDASVTSRAVLPVAFVPLTGEHAGD